MAAVEGTVVEAAAVATRARVEVVAVEVATKARVGAVVVVPGAEEEEEVAITTGLVEVGGFVVGERL